MGGDKNNQRRWWPWSGAVVLLAAMGVLLANVRQPANSRNREDALALVAEAEALGMQDCSLAARRKRLEAARDLFAELAAEHSSPQSTADMSVVQFRLGKLAELGGDVELALQQFRTASDAQEHLVAEFPGQPEFRDALADTLAAMGATLQRNGDPVAATAAFARAQTVREQLVGDFPSNAEFQRKLANVHMNLGIVAMAQDELEAAAAKFATAQQIRAPLKRRPPVRLDLAKAHFNLGQLRLLEGDPVNCVSQAETAKELLEQLIAEAPGPERYYLLSLCWALLSGAQFESEASAANSESSRQAAYVIAQRLVRDNPGVAKYARIVELLELQAEESGAAL